jgi:hypothetical protein
MKFLRLLFIFSIACVGSLHAQGRTSGGDDEDQKNKQPPVEIPDFSNLDEYIYQPKSNLNFGMRYITGVKSHFSGNGIIGAPQFLSNATAPNVVRLYNDGRVDPDSRSTSIDNGNGTSSAVSVSSDGKTQQWQYNSTKQVTSDGYLQFHIYSAQTVDPLSHAASGKGTLGMELSSSRDMGNINFGKNLSWKLFGGMAINDIQDAYMTQVKANVTTLTDTFDLFGQSPPSAPSTEGANSSTVTLTNSSGNPLLDVTGNPITLSVNTTTLISNAPVNRSITSAIDSTSVTHHWKLHGGYAEFRGGPILTWSPIERLHFSLSAGPTLLYVGSNLTVTSVLQAPIGGQIIDTAASSKNILLFGAFTDATVQYDLNERAGLYLGVFYQQAGTYNQNVDGKGAAPMLNGSYNDVTNEPTGTYSAKVDFTNQTGFRSGLAYKF